jgi:hypothetical protein
MKFPRIHKKSEPVVGSEGKEQTPKVDEAKKVADMSTASAGDPKGVKTGFYVYCIVTSTAPKEYGKIGVKDDSLVYTVPYKEVAAVISQITGESFEKTDANVLAHQRVVHRVFEQQMGVPVKFGTILESEDGVRRTLEEGYGDFRKQLSELTSKGTEAILEAAAPTDIIAEILSQSAASAVRIRQLADALETVKRQEYERGAAKLPEGTAKELLEFLARAPKGSYQTSEAATPEQIKTLDRRLDTLFEEINHMKEMMASESRTKAITMVQKEQNEIKEAVIGLRALQSQSRESIEKAISDAIKEQMSKIPPSRQVMVDVAGKGDTYPASPSHDVVLPSPSVQMEPYTRCRSCGAGIVITDRFCAHCGWQNTQGGT